MFLLCEYRIFVALAYVSIIGHLLCNVGYGDLRAGICFIVQDAGAIVGDDDVAVIVSKDAVFHKDIQRGLQKVDLIHPAVVWHIVETLDVYRRINRNNRGGSQVIAGCGGVVLILR